jgi:hypothetical protein
MHESTGSQVTLTAGMQEEFNQPNPLAEKFRHAAKGMQDHLGEPQQGTYLSEMMRSDSKDTLLALPFKLNITHTHEKAYRNIPYLRQSWTRIDFVAIVSFWVTFFLAVFGEERGKYHIGIFRALSVLRTARLLTITSGTTVSWCSVSFFLSTPTDLQPLDYHAFSENRKTSPNSGCILRAFCHSPFLYYWYPVVQRLFSA